VNRRWKVTDLFDLYVLNLLVTLAMFCILVFRAWIELRNYRLMWKELEWQQTYQAMGRILKAEKDLFSKVEGGDELYQLLSGIFKVDEKQA
jgi:hypothetical protein